jgi:hypothetical protein
MTVGTAWEPYPILLDDLHGRVVPGQLVASPAGHVLASAARLPGAPDGPLHWLGLAVSAAGPESVSGQDGVSGRFAAGLLAIHRDLLRRVLTQAIRHLDDRTSAGCSLLSMQLIEGQLAEIAMAINADEAVPAGIRDADRYSRWRSHLRLVAAGRRLVSLFGASGFLADGPGADLYLAEVTGNVYLHPGLEG